MKVAIVGSGYAGLINAKTLKDHGHTVQVFERCHDVGGVWSDERRYPGLKTQSTGESYCFSDFGMPKHYAEQPSGAQVHEYLEAYVVKNALAPLIHLNCTVNSASRVAGDKWELKTTKGTFTDFDHLIVANGVFCEGAIPRFQGIESFEAAGGQICHTNTFNSTIKSTEGKHVVIVGYGKSACDVAKGIVQTGRAASVSMVARNLVWKMPAHLYGLSYKYLLLTRFGEALYQYQKPTSMIESFFGSPGLGQGVRNAMVNTLGYLVNRQLGLKELGLEPRGTFDRIAYSTVSLSTDEIYPMVAKKQLAIYRDTEIAAIQGKRITLNNGSTIPADIIICGTGFEQRKPTFLSDDILEGLTDKRGNWMLYKNILPLNNIDNLTFAGYNSTFFSPLSFEGAALWTASYLGRGQKMLPSRAERARIVSEKIEWMEQRSYGRHSHGTYLAPFSMHAVDELLDEAGVNLGSKEKFWQWVMPVDPLAYRNCSAKLAEALKKESRV